MFKFFSSLLEKMGNWFGIIFKMILPVIVMYRPIKIFAFAVLVYGISFGGSYGSFDDLGAIIFYIVYAIFVLMLFLFPKVASCMEFVLISNYFVSLILFTWVDYFAFQLNSIDTIISVYWRAIPLVAVFLIGKILFYIFIRANRDKIEEARKKKFKNRDGLR